MTSSMPWIKIYTDIIDDPKVGRLNKADRWTFVTLCVLAGESDAEGYLVNGDSNLTIDDIAWRLRERPDELQETMDNLQAAGLLCQDEDGTWFVTNFAKRQGRPQYEKRKLWRERKRRQREREQDETDEESHEDVTEDVTRDSRVSHGLREREREREREEKDNAGKPAVGDDSRSPPGMTEGLREMLRLFGAKRFATVAQKEALQALERDHGTDVFLEGVAWAAKQGMSMGKAVVALETALPKWGKSGDKNGVIKVGR